MVQLNTEQISQLFNRVYKTIRKYINNVLEEELKDVIIVGYRVKSQNGIVFRKWANKILKDYMVKGYAIKSKKDYILYIR